MRKNTAKIRRRVRRIGGLAHINRIAEAYKARAKLIKRLMARGGIEAFRQLMTDLKIPEELQEKAEWNKSIDGPTINIYLGEQDHYISEGHSGFIEIDGIGRVFYNVIFADRHIPTAKAEETLKHENEHARTELVRDANFGREIKTVQDAKELIVSEMISYLSELLIWRTEPITFEKIYNKLAFVKDNVVIKAIDHLWKNSSEFKGNEPKEIWDKTRKLEAAIIKATETLTLSEIILVLRQSELDEIEKKLRERAGLKKRENRV